MLSVVLTWVNDVSLRGLDDDAAGEAELKFILIVKETPGPGNKRPGVCGIGSESIYLLLE